ncbi:MAG: LysR family transcriptional regulator [Firmicutes bacterium]|nr:LysR family transcriptional regulator [Bacillota bacterium]
MKLTQLQYLIEAAKYNSISIAAEKNYISQSALSSSISNLEKELNIILLERNCKGVQPTQTGELVIDKVKEVFSLIEEIRALSPDHQMDMINIAAIPCICDYLIPECIRSLTKNKQLLKISVHTDETTEIIRNVTSGFSSLGLIINDNIINLGTLKYQPLFTDRYVLYVGQLSPLYDKQSITLQEALNEPYIAYRKEFQAQNTGLSSLFNGIQKPNIAFRTDELSNIRRMIQYSDYVAFFPEKMSQKDVYLQNGSMRAIPISDFDTSITIGYVINPKYKVPKIIKEFLNLILEKFETL